MICKKKNEIYLSLGSNQGNSLQNLQNAVSKLKKIIDIKKISSVYNTEPQELKNQPYFFNIILYGITTLKPFKLLGKINQIEKEMGRIRKTLKGPRNIDIDIIFYGNIILNNKKLTLPHPSYRLRKFVLIPILEINNSISDPQSGEKLLDIVEKINPLGQQITKAEGSHIFSY